MGGPSSSWYLAAVLLIFPFRLLKPDIVQIGGRQRRPPGCPLPFADFFGVPGHPAGMPDALKIRSEIALHLDGHPIFQQILLLGQQLRGQGAQALLGILAVGGAAEIHFGIEHALVPHRTLQRRVVSSLKNSISWPQWGIGSSKTEPRLPSSGCPVRGISFCCFFLIKQ